MRFLSEISVLLCLFIIPSVYGDCKMLHICNQDSNGKYQNCLSPEGTPPEPLNATHPEHDNAVQLMKEYCPHFYENDEDPALCCDVQQVLVMIEGFQSTVPFQRCPTCVKNIMKTYCIFSCDPYQADFTNPVNFGQAEDGTTYITKVQETIIEDFIQTTFDSCKNVAYPSTSGLVIGSVCGGYGATYCTAERFFNYMGNYENTFSPFDIVFKVVNTSVSGAINGTALACNQAYDGAKACSCVDCELSCATDIKFDELTEENDIFGDVDQGSFIAACVVFGVGFISSLIVLYLRFFTPHILTRFKGRFRRESTNKTIQIKVN